MRIKNYWMMLAMALVSLCTICCGGDDDDDMSNNNRGRNENTTNRTEQKVQVGYTDQFYISNTLCDWNSRAWSSETCISSASAKLFFI